MTMHIVKLLLLVLLSTCSLLVNAQQLGSIRGTLRSATGESIPALTVKVENTTLITLSDVAGEFVLKNVAPGRHTLLVTGVGFKPTQHSIAVIAGKEARVSLRIEDAAVDMDGVTVTGRSEVTEVNRQAFNVTAIDAKPLYNTTLNLADALDRVAGVRVRETGGVGSSFNLSINGFGGNQIRYFIDGIPMEGFGSSFQVNNIPINTAERIEVYKGVVPIWLGSDALGGAVNIVTGNRHRNYVDASYSYGSFNTHRTTVNAAVTSKSGLTAQISAFQNYSDNSYRVRVDVADINSGAYAPNTWVRRFNDTFHNETMIASVGVMDKRYADKLLLGLTLGKSYQEIQNGARLVSVFGRWHRRSNLLMPTFKYKKDNLIQGLDVTLNANYNFGSEQNVDTAFVRYDWYGNFLRLGTRGGERQYSYYKYRNNNGLVTGTANYRLGEHQSLALSNVFNSFDRKGNDPLNPQAVYAPQKLQKNILGLGYIYKGGEVWSVSIFSKYFMQWAETSASTELGSKTTRLSYGAAGTYFLTPSLQLKASYELANRLPDALELFGDVINQEGNPRLRPEQSNNINVGATYDVPLGSNDRLQVTGTAIYRYAKDFIYTRYNQNQTKLILDNRDGVWTLGGDTEVRYWHKNTFSAGGTLTYQYVQNRQEYEPGYIGRSPLFGVQMPNIPILFSNADASLVLPNIGGKEDRFTIGYNLQYLYRFWLFWPVLGSRNITTADPKKALPQQWNHSINILYSLKNGRYNVGLECRNFTNALLYDNFSLQKPGRAFYVNLRYFFNKTNN